MIGNRKYQKSRKGNSQNRRQNNNNSKNQRLNKNQNQSQNRNQNQRQNRNQNNTRNLTKKRKSNKVQKTRSRRRSLTASQKKRLMRNLNKQMMRKKVRKSANKKQRKNKYSKQRGGFIAGLGGPAEIPQFCNDGHAVADLLGEQAAAAFNGTKAEKAAVAQAVINQQEGDVKKCDKALNFLKDAERTVGDRFDKITDLGILQQYDETDSAPSPTSLGLEQSMYADQRAAYNDGRTNDAVSAWSELNQLDRRYNELKSNYENNASGMSRNDLNDLYDLQFGSNTYGPDNDQRVISEYARQDELSRLWNLIPETERTRLNTAGVGGPHPQGAAATIPSLTRPA